ncbi:MAG: chromosome segregation protein SMC [Nitrospiria bacterium]
MRLKKLSVFGFKSFFDKTDVTFQSGITSIVGPNGCGKSNLVDAILWVLGEQSPKNLRGERMEDIIFSGTENRKALSLAEVVLTIGDMENELPPPYTSYAELMISRRLYRSGESDYLINKTPCRLKDIRDLLIDIGAGYRAHTIIEQGRVDDLITATPLQRREIVEETAGIAKYRLRKAEALRKLESTEQNLVRVRDIIREINRQRNGLDRQARKAEKHQHLQAELKTLVLQIAQREWQEWHQKQIFLSQEGVRLQDKGIQLEAQLSSGRLKQTEAKFLLNQKEEILSELGHDFSKCEADIQRLEAKITTIHAQRKEWIETRERTKQEASVIEEELSSLTHEEKTFDLEKIQIAAELPEKEAFLKKREEEAGYIEKKIKSATRDIDRKRVAQFDLAARLTTSKNNLLHIENRKEAIQKKRLQREAEKQALESKCKTSEHRLEQVHLDDEEIKNRLIQERTVRTDALERLNHAENRVKTLGDKRSLLKEESFAIQAEISSREGFYRGLLEDGDGGQNQLLQIKGLHGMVADLIDVPPRYEQAIEAFLETRLRGIVVENHSEIRAGIAHLQNEQLGRAVFIPRKPLSVQIEAFSQDLAERVGGEGIIGCATDLVSSRKEDEDVVLAILGNLVIVTNLNTAFKHWEQHRKSAFNLTWVTLEGEVIDPFGIVTGGEHKRNGLLSKKREIQDLSKKNTEMLSSIKSIEKEISENHTLIETTEEILETQTAKIRQLEVNALHRKNDQKNLSVEIAQFRTGLQTLRLEEEEEVREEDDLNDKKRIDQGIISETSGLQESQGKELVILQEQLLEIGKSLEIINEEIMQLNLMTTSLKEKKSHLLEKLARIARSKKELVERLDNRHLLRKRFEEKLVAGEREEAEIVSAIHQQGGALENLEQEIRREREAHETVVSSLHQLDEGIADLQSEHDQVQKEHQEKSVRKVEAEMLQKKIEEMAATQYQVEIAAYSEPENALPIDQARTRADEIRRDIEQIGPVNIAAIEEFRGLDERFNFLTTQESDLTRSMNGLREAIAKINKTTKGLFVETFHTLNRKFGEVFNDFFGGGEASLVLLDPSKPLETGIEMLAQPPGKASRTLTLLSGGEKALTAISLLFATFLIHPTPFCLLDEIDAPLDEENTRRFAETLKKMSRQTQFIVVTHNKLSMEIADVLYGVTAVETGVSKIVSVNLKRADDSKQSSIPALSSDPPEESPVKTLSNTG